MKVWSVFYGVALVFGSTQVSGHGDEPHDAGPEYTFGKPGNPAKVSRTIAVDMSDGMCFTPKKIAVKKGETIRFAVKNSGQVKHEMVLGTERELRKHAELMKKF